MSTLGIWRSPGPVETRREVCPEVGPQAEYTWRIENFSMCPQKKGESLSSTSFTVDSMDQSEFRLVLYPRGVPEDPTENISCVLECVVEPDYNISVVMNVMGSSNINPLVTKTKVCFIIRSGQRERFVLLPDREDLVTRSRAFLPNDVFTVRCTVTPMYRAPLVCDDDFLSLAEDFTHLYKNGTFSDFTVHGDTGEMFKVHKVFLSIRGNQLAENFGLMADEPVGLSIRNDISPRALDAILAYMYSGRLAEDLEPDVLDEVYQVSKRMKMDDLKRDIFPLETSTVAITIVHVDRRKVSWALMDFGRRVEAGDWPIQTFVDMTVGRFIVSFSLMEREGVVYTHIQLNAASLYAENTVFLKCRVFVDHGDKGAKPLLNSVERWFDSEAPASDNTCDMDGDHDLLYAWKSLKQYPEKLSLVFEFTVSSPMFSTDCWNEEMTNSLETPVPSKRSLHRLSSDLDIVFRDTIEEEDSDSDSDRDLCTFSDVRIRTRSGKFVRSHRCLLAVRSEKLFELILKDGSGGKRTDLEITDVSDETLEDMLRYIYSGKVKDLDIAPTIDLYVAASSYAIPALAKRCTDLMKDKIAIADIHKLLLLADDFEDESLFTLLVNFICMNRTATLNSAEWQRVVAERPSLASRALRVLSVKLGQPVSK